MRERYDTPVLLWFVQVLLERHGLSAEVARVVASGFMEADLLGFPTHGLIRVPANLRWLSSGETRPAGEPRVLVDRPALANWDAERLPGHWAMHLAAQRAIRGAAEAGSFTLTLRRCQHIACAAAALVPLVEAELIALLMVSSPEEAYVSPFGGSRRLFSNNPLAFTAPAADGPILFDISMAITAGGQIARAARQGRRLPEPAIVRPGGAVTDDPGALEPDGAIMPLGGLGHGHKGHALTLMTEVLSQALAGHGRARAAGTSEQNSVFLQVFDPGAFADRGDYDREVDHLLAMIEGCPPDDPRRPVRVPGRRAWRERLRQMRDGVVVDREVMTGLRPFAERAGLSTPEPVSLVE
ncbi:MAG TPA: Ldh family oxidoreductase [Pseudomonadales bacterium]